MRSDRGVGIAGLPTTAPAVMAAVRGAVHIAVTDPSSRRGDNGVTPAHRRGSEPSIRPAPRRSLQVRVAVVFPGQGTQAPAMGRPWKGQPSWSVVERAETALGEPLAPLLLDADADDLARTRNSQLAVLLTSLMAWDALAPRLAAAPDLEIVAFAGHSLGQVTALVAAGASPSTTASASPPAAPSSRRPPPTRIPAAWPRCSAPPRSRPHDACAAAPDACWLANDNAPGQIVHRRAPPTASKPRSPRAKRARRQAARCRSPSAARSTRRSWTTRSRASRPRSRDLPLHDAGRTRRVERRRQPRTSTPTAGANGSRCHVTRPVRWRASMETLARPGRDRVLRSRARLDDRRRRQAHGARRRRVRHRRPRSRRHPRRCPIMRPTHHGELLDVPERMIVAPSVGVFRPTSWRRRRRGRRGRGDRRASRARACRCRSAARSAAGSCGMLAHPGERLREGQPVAWLAGPCVRVADATIVGLRSRGPRGSSHQRRPRSARRHVGRVDRRAHRHP